MQNTPYFYLKLKHSVGLKTTVEDRLAASQMCTANKCFKFQRLDLFTVKRHDVEMSQFWHPNDHLQTAFVILNRLHSPESCRNAIKSNVSDFRMVKYESKITVWRPFVVAFTLQRYFEIQRLFPLDWNTRSVLHQNGHSLNLAASQVNC